MPTEEEKESEEKGKEGREDEQGGKVENKAIFIRPKCCIQIYKTAS